MLVEKKVKILMTRFVTHDVKSFIVEKPKGYKFKPGQATDVSINKPKWKKEMRPFTFASLNNDLVLEFIIKTYPERKGVTKQIHRLKPGDELIIGDPWGTIKYKGPGVFIAGGAGITPFIAILRDLKRKGKLFGNTLIFSNKTRDDVILEQELIYLFKDTHDLILTLTCQKTAGYEYGRVDKKFLKKYINDFSQNFYICGPKVMVKELTDILSSLGAKTDSIVLEK